MKRIALAALVAGVALAAPAGASAAQYLHVDEAIRAVQGQPTPGNSYNDYDIGYTCARIGCSNFENGWAYTRQSSTRVCVTVRFIVSGSSRFINYRSYRDGEWKINDAEGC